MKEMEEVLRLFRAALDYLTVRKDPITSKALYTMAQELLDELGRNMVSPAGVLVRKARPIIRQRLMHEQSLHKKFEITLAFWSQTAGEG